MDRKIIDHYLEYSQYTYPGLYEQVLQESLPDDVQALGYLVRRQLLHAAILQNGNTGSNCDLRYGDTSRIPWTRQREDDVFVTSSAMLAELYRRDPRGLVLDRGAENMLVVTCRHTAVLMATLLKIKGIPARVRSGFAPYFDVEGLPGDKSVDHWIDQYWSKKQSRWVTIDVDGSIEGYLEFDPYDMPEGVYDYAADAWLGVRDGSMDGEHFYNAGGRGGLVAISWELFYDFHCLMNDEVIYHHHPAITHLDRFETLSESMLSDIDHLARLMQEPDGHFDELQHLWETKREFRLVKGGLIS